MYGPPELSNVIFKLTRVAELFEGSRAAVEGQHFGIRHGRRRPLNRNRDQSKPLLLWDLHLKKRPSFPCSFPSPSDS
ncbi:hypothetical protein HZ326_15632 [Fusarium oxysporum f. sp. albedinis]|nr:hypothetical protein HZ326_15632 [Fusarium oxysporum f. sp. albedinis]